MTIKESVTTGHTNTGKGYYYLLLCVTGDTKMWSGLIESITENTYVNNNSLGASFYNNIQNITSNKAKHFAGMYMYIINI